VIKPWLNSATYVVGRGLRGMVQSPLVQLIAIGTMAVCMLMLGTTMLIFQNAQGVAQGWGVDIPMTVYMVEGADASRTEALAERLQALPEVEKAERITPELALHRLEEGLGAQNSMLLEGIDPQALPDSIEVSLVEDGDAGFAAELADRVEQFDEVEEVAALGPWVEQVREFLGTLRWLAIGIALLVSGACMAIVWSTIRLGVFARRAEIQILRLVGGTPAFVRAPFLVEGMLQGVLGATLALVTLWLAFDFVRPFLEDGLSLMFAAGSIRFFGPLRLAMALCFGASLGYLGSRAAVARYVEA
jgi:cell division transport system permease protein